MGFGSIGVNVVANIYREATSINPPMIRNILLFIALTLSYVALPDRIQELDVPISHHQKIIPSLSQLNTRMKAIDNNDIATRATRYAYLRN